MIQGWRGNKAVDMKPSVTMKTTRLQPISPPTLHHVALPRQARDAWGASCDSREVQEGQVDDGPAAAMGGAGRAGQ
jgi:hypothetical protein